MMIKNFIASLLVSSIVASALSSDSSNEIQRQRSPYAGSVSKNPWERRQQFQNPAPAQNNDVLLQRRQRSPYAGSVAKNPWEKRQQFQNPALAQSNDVLLQRRQRSPYAGSVAKNPWERRQHFLNPNNEDTSIVRPKASLVQTEPGNTQPGQYDSVVYSEPVDQSQGTRVPERNYNLPSYFSSQR